MNSLNIKSIGFWIGLSLFFLILFIPNPDGLSTEGRLTLAVFSLMGVWWAFESLPLQVTALMPLILFPLLGVIEIGIISKEYMNKVQFLFAGGFIIAIAIQKWGLHKRVALNILRLSGLNANNIIASFMLASALLSMWVMNTSTAIMLLPVAISVIKVITDTVKEIDKDQSYNFQLCLLLGIAYSASLGGIATPIGTSPNGVLIQFANDNFDKDIGFASWISFGLPVTLILGPLVWFLLTKFIYKGKNLFPVGIDAMMGGISLFFISQKNKQDKLLNWDDTQSGFPWGLIFLFGGGMALAYVVNDSGLALWLASLIPSETYFFIVLLIVITMVILLTELTSNLTTTVTFLPVVASVGVNLGIDPMLLILPLTLSASCAFMLPVATPPNSIVYASGLIPIQKMVKAGIFINLVSIVFLFLLAYFFIPSLI